MPENKVQFQKGLSLPEFTRQFGTEEQCHAALTRAKWPQGFVCSECGHKAYSYIESRNIFQCNACKYQTTVTRGTVFHSTNLPLTIWFLAMYFMTQHKNGISSMALKRLLGVSYKTAWRLHHKLSQVMVERDAIIKLTGLVEVDDAYLGGQKTEGKRGRGSENKQPFVAAVQVTTEYHPTNVRLSPVSAFTKKEIESWSKSHLDRGCHVHTDGLRCFNGFDGAVKTHSTTVMKNDPNTGKKPYLKWVNTILGNVKSSITGTYRSNSSEYSSRYLGEFQYRINRRYDLSAILIRLVYAAAQTPPLPGRLLRLAANST